MFLAVTVRLAIEVSIPAHKGSVGCGECEVSDKVVLKL